MEARAARRSRAEQVANNRRALLDAALRVFRRVGYASASLDAIADDAGFTKGAVYSHFDSKADLFLSLLEDRIDRRAQAQREWTSRRLRPAEVFDVVHRVYAASDDDPEWRLAQLEFRVLAARDPALNARYAAVHRRTLDAIVETLGTLVAGAGITLTRPLQELAQIGAVVDGGRLLEDRTDPGSWSAERAAELFCDIAGLPVPRASHRRPKGG
jgi:AcrR family transcriptional regulator